MGKFDGVLLVSDFDDTLCGTNLTGGGPDQVEQEHGVGQLLSDVNQQALESFLAQGGRFTVATGRSRRTFDRFAHRLPINAPAILSNGAVIYDFSQGRELFSASLRPQVVEDMRALSLAMPHLGFETQFDHIVCIHSPNEITWRHLRRLGLEYEARPLEEMPQPWVKLVIQDSHEELRKAQAFLLERWGDIYEAIFSNANLLEVTPKGCNKGGLVLRLAKLLGIAQKDIYCVGDNQNDIPMLAVSAVPFAPANCAQEVRDWGANILCSCDDGCVAQAVAVLDSRY